MKIKGILITNNKFFNSANVDGVKEVLLNSELSLNNYFNSVYFNNNNLEEFKNSKKTIWLSGVTPSVFSDACQSISFNINDEYDNDLFYYSGVFIDENEKPIRFYIKNNEKKKSYWLGDYYKNSNNLVLPLKAFKRINRNIYKDMFKYIINNNLIEKNDDRENSKKFIPKYRILSQRIIFTSNNSNTNEAAQKLYDNLLNNKTFKIDVNNYFIDSKKEYTFSFNKIEHIENVDSYINEIDNVFNLIKNIDIKYVPLINKNENTAIQIKIDAGYDNLFNDENFNRLLYYYLGSFLLRNLCGDKYSRTTRFVNSTYVKNCLLIPKFLFINKNILGIALKIATSLIEKYVNEFEFEINDNHIFARPDEVANIVNMAKEDIEKYYNAIKAYGKNPVEDIFKHWDMSLDEFIKTISNNEVKIVKIEKINTVCNNISEVIFNEKDTFSDRAKEYLNRAVALANYNGKVIFYGFKKEKGLIFSGLYNTSVEHPEKFKAIMIKEPKTKCFGLPYSTRVNDEMLAASATAIESILKQK